MDTLRKGPLCTGDVTSYWGIRAVKMSPAAQLRVPWTPLMPNEVAKGASLAGSQQGKLCKAKT